LLPVIGVDMKIPIGAPDQILARLEAEHSGKGEIAVDDGAVGPPTEDGGQVALKEPAVLCLEVKLALKTRIESSRFAGVRFA
jgi:hypothetical protein